VGNVSLIDTLAVSHLWQSLLLAGVLALALRLGARMPGATRYGLAAGAFLASLLLPLSVFIPAQSALGYLLEQTQAPVGLRAPTPVADMGLSSSPAVRQLTPDPATTAAVTAAPPAPASDAGAAGIAAPQAQPLLAAVPASVSERPLPAPGWLLVGLWLGVSALLIVRVVCDLLAVERLVSRARPADLPPALRARLQGVRVCVSPDAPGPMAAGLFRPCIILPEAIALSSPGMLGLLEHEYAHIRRRDMLAALIQRLTLALLWWSPALYWISRRMDEEREIACDEAAVARTGDARALARSLTSEAERQSWARAPRLAVGAIGPRSHFGQRVRRLIDSARHGASPHAYAGRLAIASLAMVAVLSALAGPRVQAQAQAPQEARPEAAPPGLQTPAARSAQAQTAEAGAARRARPGAEAPVLDLSEQGASVGLQAADLGLDIAVSVLEGLMAEMPAVGEEISRALAEAGLEAQAGAGWRELAGADLAEARAALEEARAELKAVLGPELQAEIHAEIRASLRQARSGIAAAREDVAQALPADGDAISRAVGQAVSEALEAAGLALDTALSGDGPPDPGSGTGPTPPAPDGSGSARP